MLLKELAGKLSASDLPERCASPLRPRCGSTEIALYIYFGGRRLPICWRCWREIANSSLQWSADSPERDLAEEVERVEAEVARRLAIEALTELAKRISRGRRFRRK